MSRRQPFPRFSMETLHFPSNLNGKLMETNGIPSTSIKFHHIPWSFDGKHVGLMEFFPSGKFWWKEFHGIPCIWWNFDGKLMDNLMEIWTLMESWWKIWWKFNFVYFVDGKLMENGLRKFLWWKFWWKADFVHFLDGKNDGKWT